MDINKIIFPNGWEIRPMPKVVKWASGGTPKATEKAYYENGTIPWLIIGDLNDGIVLDSATKITELGLKNSSAKMVPKNTLLVAMYGSIGKLGITGIECCTNQAIAFAKELYGVTTKYMYYYMMLIKSDLITKGKGGTQKNISQTVLNSFYVPVPPMEEQEKIVARIEELFSQLDSGVETLKKIKQQLAVYRQAVLKEAFSPLHYVEELKDLATMIDPQPSHRTPPKVEGGIPYIGIGDINYKDNKIDFDSARKVSTNLINEHKNRYTINNGDFIMGKIGTIGKPFRLPLPQDYVLSANVILIQPNSKKILPEFLYWQFSSNIVTKQLLNGATATSQPAFGITKARFLKIRMCDLKTQKTIIKKIEQKLSICDSIENTVAVTLQQSQSLKQSILKNAFEGGLL